MLIVRCGQYEPGNGVGIPAATAMMKHIFLGWSESSVLRMEREGYWDDGEPYTLDVLNEESMSLKIEKAISSLTGHIERLSNKYREMVERSKTYLDRCVEALMTKDDERAKIYASEIAEIRKLANIIVHSQLLLLQVKIRLESILELGEAITLIKPLTQLLQNVMSEITDVAPEASEHLKALMVMIESFVSSTGYTATPDARITEISDEARFIMEEARRIAAEKVRESFPEAPQLTEQERAVYSYVASANDGELDLITCSNTLKMDVDTITDTLRSLHKKGLIELEMT
jgi:division protein CdvB (Snf7/Vps24/ESCRT-III family)